PRATGSRAAGGPARRSPDMARDDMARADTLAADDRITRAPGVGPHHGRRTFLDVPHKSAAVGRKLGGIRRKPTGVFKKPRRLPDRKPGRPDGCQTRTSTGGHEPRPLGKARRNLEWKYHSRYRGQHQRGGADIRPCVQRPRRGNAQPTTRHYSSPAPHTKRAANGAGPKGRRRAEGKTRGRLRAHERRGWIPQANGAYGSTPGRRPIKNHNNGIS